MINSIITLILILAIVFMVILMIKNKLNKIIAISLSCLIIAGITVLTLYPIHKKDEPNLEEAQVKLNAFESEKFIDAISLDVLTSIGEYKVVGPKNAYYIKTIKYSDFYINDIVFVNVISPTVAFSNDLGAVVDFKAQRYITYYNKSYYVKELEEYCLTNFEVYYKMSNIESKNPEDVGYDLYDDYGNIIKDDRIGVKSKINSNRNMIFIKEYGDWFVQVEDLKYFVRETKLSLKDNKEDYSAEKYKIMSEEMYYALINTFSPNDHNMQKSYVDIKMSLDIIVNGEIINLYNVTSIYSNIYDFKENVDNRGPLA